MYPKISLLNLNSFSGLLSILLLLLTPYCFALPSDQDEPCKIKSDTATYDYANHKIFYIGHVFVTQGTSQLQADQVVVYQTPKNVITRIVATGNLAHYSTIPEPNKERLFSEANSIDYKPGDKTVLLISNVKVTQAGDQITGSHILYDMEHDILHSIPDPSLKSPPRTVVILEGTAKRQKEEKETKKKQ